LTELPRYSILEIERRWLVDIAALGSLAATPYRLYQDLYIWNSRLRLRKITEVGCETLFKLGKKYGKQSRLSEPITTLYLTEAEYLGLVHLPGHYSSKRRYTMSEGFLDVYEKPNCGLMIFELEFDDEMSAKRYRPPHFVGNEITGEHAYSGFQLAQGGAGA